LKINLFSEVELHIRLRKKKVKLGFRQYTPLLWLDETLQNKRNEMKGNNEIKCMTIKWCDLKKN